MVNGPRPKNTTTGANRGSLAIAIALAGIAIAIGALVVILALYLPEGIDAIRGATEAAHRLAEAIEGSSL